MKVGEIIEICNKMNGIKEYYDKKYFYLFIFLYLCLFFRILLFNFYPLLVDKTRENLKVHENLSFFASLCFPRFVKC